MVIRKTLGETGCNLVDLATRDSVGSAVDGSLAWGVMVVSSGSEKILRRSRSDQKRMPRR